MGVAHPKVEEDATDAQGYRVYLAGVFPDYT